MVRYYMKKNYMGKDYIEEGLYYKRKNYMKGGYVMGREYTKKNYTRRYYLGSKLHKERGGIGSDCTGKNYTILYTKMELYNRRTN